MQPVISTVIVEDEPLSRLYLGSLLAESCPDISVAGSAQSESEAVSLINELQPSLVFLDIELQTGTGFGVVSRLPLFRGHIIFTTALDEHATNILRLAGVPFIEKPIDGESLAAAVNSVRNAACASHHSNALAQLHETLSNGNVPRTIFVGGQGEAEYIPLQDIVAIESTGGECLLKLSSGSMVSADYPLKQLELMLAEFGFFRSHMHHIINRRHVHNGASIRDEQLYMSNGLLVPVSPKKEAALRSYLASEGAVRNAK